MRLFVAIAPPPAVLDQLESGVEPFRAAWPALRWTGRQTWHVTLAFLGEVGEDAAAALRPRLARAAGRHPSLSLSFSGAGAFPSRARARVLWKPASLGGRMAITRNPRKDGGMRI